jgi:hypothetical protein
VANDFQGVLNLSGSFIAVTTNPITDTVLLTNTGVTTISGSAAISVSSASGNVTITNTGVTSLTSGNGINVSSATGGVTIENTGVLELTTDPGSGITISAGTGVINISNAAPNVNQNVFQFIDVGPDTLDPDNPSDTLEIIQGSGISLAVNNISKSLTITNNGVTSLTVGAGLTVSSGAGAVTLNLSSPIINNFIGDLKGSVFADDSSVMIDAAGNRIFVGNGLYGNVIGNTTGYHTGDVTGSVFADNSTMLIDGTNGQIVGPINSFDGSNSISMSPIYGVLIGGTGGANIIGAAGAPIYIGGGPSGSTSGDVYIGNGSNRTLFVSNIIDTDDSSTLIFEPPVTFNTNISVEGDISVVGVINGYISLLTLKSIVADSTSFSDFQARIAALV